MYLGFLEFAGSVEETAALSRLSPGNFFFFCCGCLGFLRRRPSAEFSPAELSLAALFFRSCWMVDDDAVRRRCCMAEGSPSTWILISPPVPPDTAAVCCCCWPPLLIVDFMSNVGQSSSCSWRRMTLDGRMSTKGISSESKTASME